MNRILEINGIISRVVWGWPMIILLLGTGVLLTIITKGIIITKTKIIFKNTIMQVFGRGNAGKGELTPFQAVSTALAATVGTGNIAGVALAIAVGGPGAVFWIWVSAILGMVTKFSEVILSIAYRIKNKKNGTYSGGPMYYISRGAKMKWLATLFALFASLAAFGIGNMTQSNSIAQALKTQFNIDECIVGIVITLLTAVVVVGGIKRIGTFTGKLVPIMALFYIIGALIVIFIKFDQLGNAFGLIFTSAFSGTAAVGGFAGSSFIIAIEAGISRGVFTNEAGLGSGPIAHAAAKTDHPVRQGMWGIFEVFVDTIVICTMTALVVIVSGKWDSGIKGAALTTEAFNSVISGGGIIVSLGLTLFAFSTIIGWYYYGEKSFEFLVGEKYSKYYKYVYIPFIFVGAIGGLKEIWEITDTLNGLMAIPNLIGVVLLSGVVVRLVKDFFKNPDTVRKSEDEYKHLLK